MPAYTSSSGSNVAAYTFSTVSTMAAYTGISGSIAAEYTVSTVSSMAYILALLSILWRLYCQYYVSIY
jgi:hypothetical protein